MEKYSAYRVRVRFIETNLLLLYCNRIQEQEYRFILPFSFGIRPQYISAISDTIAAGRK
jgi:hypothetical protein